ncbi:uncharacterized protein LOC110273610 [Arachis duranensis]|uniref:Uncharacterized protein LOC110273610 n=1 Tax=Arachis duranensis TaxID=130453 RepID=A0A6P5MHJ5_ARADU|nr:uncharacterized protein LOC110273610 [Arachis duranensis]
MPRKPRSSDDEDYDPEADDVDSLDVYVDDLYAEEEAVPRNKSNGHKDTDYWSVVVSDKVSIFNDGVTRTMSLSVKEAVVLLPSKQIILEFNEELQPIGQVAILLSGFLGSLGADFQHFSINEESWKTMDNALKEHAYDTIKKIFRYEEDDNRKNAGNDSEARKNLEGSKKPLKRCRQNALNRSKQLYTHTGGSKTTARLKDEEEAIASIESKGGTLKEISVTDSLAQVLGKEHSGRVRGLGFGSCPTEIIRKTTQSNSGVQIEEYQREITKLKAVVAKQKAEITKLKAAAVEHKAKIQTIENLFNNGYSDGHKKPPLKVYQRPYYHRSTNLCRIFSGGQKTAAIRSSNRRHLTRLL